MRKSTIDSISAVDVMCRSPRDSSALIFASSICLMARPKSSQRAGVSLYVSQSGIRWRRWWTSSTVPTHLWPKLLPATWEVITKISSGHWTGCWVRERSRQWLRHDDNNDSLCDNYNIKIVTAITTTATTTSGCRRQHNVVVYMIIIMTTTMTLLQRRRPVDNGTTMCVVECNCEDDDCFATIILQR